MKLSERLVTLTDMQTQPKKVSEQRHLSILILTIIFHHKQSKIKDLSMKWQTYRPKTN